jgi:hypothetical protein
MTDFSCRNFLFGTVATAAAGTALILRSPAEAIELFRPTLAETLAIARVPHPDPQDVADPWGVGATLYNAEGTPVLEVHSYTIQVNVDTRVEVTAFGDVHRNFRDRLVDRYSMEVKGSPIRLPYPGKKR